jgi:hypothetical protein
MVMCGQSARRDVHSSFVRPLPTQPPNLSFHTVDLLEYGILWTGPVFLRPTRYIVVRMDVRSPSALENRTYPHDHIKSLSRSVYSRILSVWPEFVWMGISSLTEFSSARHRYLLAPPLSRIKYLAVKCKTNLVRPLVANGIQDEIS